LKRLSLGMTYPQYIFVSRVHSSRISCSVSDFTIRYGCQRDCTTCNVILNPVYCCTGNSLNSSRCDSSCLATRRSNTLERTGRSEIESRCVLRFNIRRIEISFLQTWGDIGSFDDDWDRAN